MSVLVLVVAVVYLLLGILFSYTVLQAYRDKFKFAPEILFFKTMALASFMISGAAFWAYLPWLFQ